MRVCGGITNPRSSNGTIASWAPSTPPRRVRLRRTFQGSRSPACLPSRAWADRSAGRSVRTETTFEPRIGAAWRVRDRWVLQGGYGLYYLGQNERGAALGFSQRSDAVVSTDGNFRPAVDLANPFANLPNGRLLEPVGASLGASSFLGQSIPVNYFDRPLPYSHQFSFDIQRELPGNLLAEVGYVANITRALPVNTNANVIPANLLGRRTSAGSSTPRGTTSVFPTPCRV